MHAPSLHKNFFIGIGGYTDCDVTIWVKIMSNKNFRQHPPKTPSNIYDGDPNCLNLYHNYHHVKRVPLISTQRSCSLSEPHKTKRQFNTQKTTNSTQNNDRSTVRSTVCWTDAILVLNWRFYVLNRRFFCGEATHLNCWNDEFSGLKRTGPGVELMCLTESYSIKTIPTNNVRYLQIWFL